MLFFSFERMTKKRAIDPPFAVLKAGCMDQKTHAGWSVRSLLRHFHPVQTLSSPRLLDRIIMAITVILNDSEESKMEPSRLNTLISANKVSWKSIKTNFHHIHFEYSQSCWPVGLPTFDFSREQTPPTPWIWLVQSLWQSLLDLQQLGRVTRTVKNWAFTLQNQIQNVFWRIICLFHCNATLLRT